MLALGIETSCDETSCAVVNKREVISNVTLSSLKFHKKYGGIIPEIATRNHLKVIDRVYQRALKEAKVFLNDIDLIGVTVKPGLVGALIVGMNFAKGLALAKKKPFLGVNHLYAHLFAPFLNTSQKIPLPFIGLVVSGGHTELFLVKDFDIIESIGKTRDDAAGEVFDKVARVFGLGYPGGVYIDRLFDHRVKDYFKFKCGRIGLDFSFSGIKTALIYKKMELEKKSSFNEDIKIKLLSSFQESVVKTIVENLTLATERFKIKSVVCGGGVIANKRLRELLNLEAVKNNWRLYLPASNFSLDNGAMVAGLTSYLYTKRKRSSSFKIEVSSLSM
ncbi:MAG: tRNA (adenosine(37)-N6)-threonylcarbamoyltransferase complex transferase subunit TsaD [Candidatus Omnitrophica bacterium]|nr:tRNA (adenosine(37)-N6)-threonylcarbamoyltransferase complex transferase subunit TsaD [Candidatus Omnitrophota bacterium]MCM8826934.1 tRNA (adenosine(37)-N6)-threonylcarbamoyltransferase complex transferase subunit TsaD [Candidatus Omnitrophota bacterium]